MPRDFADGSTMPTSLCHHCSSMLRRPASIKLLDLFGIRVGVDGSWFLILFLMIFWLSGDFRQALHSSDGVAYLTTVVTVLVLFASLVVHELGHALVARAHGIDVRRIDLFLFGGLTQMSRDAATPGEDFKIAAAGPAATLGFVLLCLAANLLIVGPSRVWHAIVAGWRRGAVLAGSSAGAMAFGEWTLIRKAYPGHAERRYKPALALLRNAAVAPHFETFGHRWVDTALAEPPIDRPVIVGIDERSAAVWDGNGWTASGPGSVTVITPVGRASYAPGFSVPLPAPAYA